MKRAAADDRAITLGPDLAAIPERLLLEHARGRVLFICGAGASIPAGLPDFRQLVLDVYEALDPGAHAVLTALPQGACNLWEADCSALTEPQKAEVRRFIQADYDVVLGMLERRLDTRSRSDSRVRSEVSKRLQAAGTKPAAIHSALMRLADRGGASTIVTTNFDALLEVASRRLRLPAEMRSLGSIPRPSRQPEFSGVLHIHGAIDPRRAQQPELILSDQDFGELYLRRRTVPDFIYDAARLFHLVLVGYSANDPPMRYLLNAVAADGSRFEDLRERFTFFGTNTPDLTAHEDWKARGITPIPYSAANNHAALRLTLERWAELSAVNGNPARVDAVVRKIVKIKRKAASEANRDLFDHLFRRSNPSERTRLSSLAASAKADIGWLEAMIAIDAESYRR